MKPHHGLGVALTVHREPLRELLAGRWRRMGEGVPRQLRCMAVGNGESVPTGSFDQGRKDLFQREGPFEGGLIDLLAHHGLQVDQPGTDRLEVTRHVGQPCGELGQKAILAVTPRQHRAGVAQCGDEGLRKRFVGVIGADVDIAMVCQAPFRIEPMNRPLHRDLFEGPRVRIARKCRRVELKVDEVERIGELFEKRLKRVAGVGRIVREGVTHCPLCRNGYVNRDGAAAHVTQLADEGVALTATAVQWRSLYHRARTVAEAAPG